MKKKLWLYLTLLLVIPGLLTIASCAKKTVEGDLTRDEAAARIASERLTPEETVSTIDEKSREEEAARRKMIADRNLFMNENIYFDFDESNLKPEAREVLKSKALWLRNNPGESVIIEGHCDERGTNEYNLALGDRRAQSAKNFLIDMGIAGSRITTISYGEERPADRRHNESAWAKNRRDHFVLE